VAYGVSIGLLIVAAFIAVICGISLIGVLWELAAGHPNAGSDPAGFGIGLGYTVLGTLAGIVFAGIALLAYRPIWPWAVAGLAVHASIFVANIIADRWNQRLVKKNAP
jgi:hypothetical protein